MPDGEVHLIHTDIRKHRERLRSTNAGVTCAGPKGSSVLHLGSSCYCLGLEWNPGLLSVCLQHAFTVENPTRHKANPSDTPQCCAATLCLTGRDQALTV